MPHKKTFALLGFTLLAGAFAQSAPFDSHKVLVPGSSWTISYTQDDNTAASYVFKLDKAFYDKADKLIFGTHSDGTAIVDDGSDDDYLEWREENIAWYAAASDENLEFLAFNQSADSGDAGYCVVLNPSKSASQSALKGYRVSSTAELDWFTGPQESEEVDLASLAEGLSPCTITLNK